MTEDQTIDDPREPDFSQACAAFNARPSAMAAPVADALAAVAELQRVAAAMAPLIPLAGRFEAAVAALEIIAGIKRCGCVEPRPVALAAGFMCTECGGRCAVAPETPA